MATPSEKKAFIFVAVVALLGSGVRLWRLQHPPTPPKFAHVSGADDDDEPQDRSSTRSRSTKSHGKPHKNTRSKPTPIRDSTSIVDLDRASLHDIEALGVLKPGLARLIVADRDTFGPFGSFHELERVPYLNKSDLRALAPRVTFSLLPRPKNAVIFQRFPPDPIRQQRHPSRKTTLRSAQ